MKKILSLLALVILTIGLLGSCSKINERIDDLDKRINNLESDKIASVEQQIAAINQSIADLETIRTNIQTLIEAKTAQGEDITALKAANTTLEGKIAELKTYLDTDLAKFATTEWVNATFATLEKQAEIIIDVEKLKQELSDLDENLDKAISDLESGMKTWVNEQLSAYCTTAQMEAKVKALQDQIEALKADNETNKSDIEELESGLAQLKQDLAAAKATIKTEYEKAIKDALKSNDGYITEEIKTAINSVKGDISDLTSKVRTLDTKVTSLRGDVDALKGMIQSVAIVPAYSDGSVEADEDGELTINCIISPASAVTGLSIDNFKVLLNEVKTKAGAYITLNANSFQTIDADAGKVKITADISAYTILDNGKALTAAVKVEKGVSKFTTKFVGITCGVTVVQTVPSSAATFTLADNKKVRLIIEPRTANLTLQYDDNSQYPEKLEVRIKDGGKINAELSGNLPFTHVDFTSGHIDHTSLTTSSSTLAVVTPATIGTLEVKGGNVVIKGATVQSIEVAADAVADPVTKAPVQIEVVKYSPEPTEEDPNPEEKKPVVAEGIKANANVIVAPAADVEVKVTAQGNVQVANEGEGTVKDSSDKPIKTKAAAQIGDATYITLSDALNTVPDGNNQTVTIDILDDIVLKASDALTINKNNVVIDGQSKYTIALDETDGALSSYVDSKYGQFKMITVSGKNVTLKNITLDSKKYRGASLATTVGGENVVYENINYEGKGCAHYYGTNGNGLITFKNCKINTCGYGVHSDTATSGIVIEDCEIHGWNAFGSAVTKVTINDSKFYGAEDSKNGTLAAFSIYCPTTFTNCTFSKEFHQKDTYEGLFMSAETLVSLNGCSVDEGELYNMVRIDDSDWPSGSVVAIDATGNATDGFTAGTFVAKQASDIKVNDSFVVKPVEGTANVFTVSAKPPVAKIGDTGYASLQAAFDAVPDGVETTVTLTDDATYATLGDKNNIGAKTVILNLNGHSITGHMRGITTLTGSTSLDGATLVNYANLTINGEGTIGDLEGDYHHNALVNMSDGTNLTINGGTFVAKSCCVYHYSASSEANTASININGGNFKAYENAATNKYVFGIGGKSGQTLTFNYGNAISEASVEGAKGIYCSLAGTTINIHSGSITANINAIYLSSGKDVTINIDGGTLKTLDSENHKNNYNSNGTYCGSSLPIYASAFGSENIVCKISGGEFIYPYYSCQSSGTIPATWERVINAGKGITSNVANANITASLTGGTYSTNQMLSNITNDQSEASGIVAEGYTCVKNDGTNTWSVVPAGQN